MSTSQKEQDFFLKRFDKIIKRCFRKVRIKKTKHNELDKLFERWNKLRKGTTQEEKDETKIVEDELADKYSNEYYGKIKEATQDIDTISGGYNSGRLWKLKRQMFPNSKDSPTAMIDQEGNLQTEPEEIKKAATQEYMHRLRNRPIKQGLEDVQIAKENLCYERIKSAQLNKTPDWTKDELEKVLKHLKKDASRDPHGYPNELFKPDVAGDDLKEAVLTLMNAIKKEQVIPEQLKWCNITSIWKRKLSKHSFKAYRGIFRVTVLRNILDLLIYKDEFPRLDEQISDCNVGGRKGRNVRDNIFVLNAILNENLKGNKEALDIQAYDAEECYDALWLQECINALFEAGFQNDKLSLLYLINTHAQFAVKTASGITERKDIFNIVMQGTVWGTAFCVMIMNKLIKLVELNPDLLFQYKGRVPVPPLEMVDDVLSIQKCGATSVAINSTINGFMETEKITLSKSKTHVIHVGKYPENCADLKVHESFMAKSDTVKCLGDKLDKSGKPRATILDRKSKGYGIVGQIVAISEEAPLGRWRMKSAMMLRNAMLVNSMLFNSEAWQGIVKDDTEQLTRVDISLFRKLVSAHCKTPLEAFFLECGQLPLQFIWASRRLLYLQTLLKRSSTEVTRQIFDAQKEQYRKGDFVQLVNEDAQNIDLVLNEEEISQMSRYEYKKLIRWKIKNAAFGYLTNLQKTH